MSVALKALQPVLALALLFPVVAARAATVPQFLPRIGTGSTVAPNGDVNPIGAAFVPVGFSGGTAAPGDLLMSDFNDSENLQGTGSTLLRLSNGTISTFYQGSAGYGLSGALAALSAGYVLAGYVPTYDGTPATVQKGGVLVLNASGQLLGSLTDPNLLQGPWGMAVDDLGSSAAVFVSNVLSGTITRLTFSFSGGSLSVTSLMQIASGFAHRLDPAALVVGPSGLAFDAKHDVLYVASTADNAVYALKGALSTVSDLGTGRLVIQDAAHLHGPEGLALAPNGHLIVASGDVVNADQTQPSEICEYAVTGQFVAEYSVDANLGGAFGLAVHANPDRTFEFGYMDDNRNVVTTQALAR